MPNRLRRRVAAGAAAAAVMSVTSCGLVLPSEDPPGPPAGVVPAHLAGLPLGTPRERDVTVAAAAETGPGATDPCALHDPAAAAAVTGQPLVTGPAGPYQPYGEINSCELRTGDTLGAVPTSSWSLTTTAGVGFEPVRDGAVPDMVGGQPVWRLELGRSCEFYRPSSPGLAYRLSVRPDGGGSSRELPPGTCALARQYLTALTPRWAHPPRRSEHTPGVPTVALARLSPCEPLRPLLTQIPPTPGAVPGRTRIQHGHHGHPDPSRCSITDQVPTPGGVGMRFGGNEHARATVQFQLSTPNRTRQNGGWPSTEIHSRSSCDVWVDVGAPIAAHLAVAPQVQATADTCPVAEQVATAAATAAQTRGAV